VPNLPRLRALALFGRRPPECDAPLVMPASKNQNIRRHVDLLAWSSHARSGVFLAAHRKAISHWRHRASGLNYAESCSAIQPDRCLWISVGTNDGWRAQR
jgi:hypothetical protein